MDLFFSSTPENGNPENPEQEKLANLTVEDIVRKSRDEEIITSDIVPFNNVRNNSKIFLIYYAKSQLARVIKLTNYLQLLEDRVMDDVIATPGMDIDQLLRVVQTIQSSVNSALQLIDKISTNDNYVSLIYNDNRQQLIDSSKTLISNRIEISRDSREKLRRIAENLLNSIGEGEDSDTE